MNKPMSLLFVSSSLAVVVALCAPASWAAVAVSFTKAEQYIDLPFMTHDREQTLASLKQHFEKLGAKLPAGQDLTVEVLDVDLAGRLEPSKLSIGQELRVLRGGADWPMIQLRYRVEAGGKMVNEGEARLTDLNYLRTLNRYPSGEPLRYEKAMLDDWFTKKILPPK